ncbi:hypothetical protein [Nitrosomonas sp.]|uniref:hypothetical protein n=1 Tax=Nitrosomonas sp. TaxID=42353 RepID=UPI001D44AF38|nr:hypothetical protein [Nitrosomonas sp.]MBX3617133.1 hypothetical protein [Nitrosomonas sp.]
MNKKLSVYLAIVPIFMVLIGCAQVGSVNPQDTVGKNAKTHQEHNNLASYYDNIAMEMDSKVAQNKALLKDYEGHSEYYGRRGQDFHSHATANLRHYEQEAQNALKKAEFHRKIAAELLKRDYAQSSEADPTATRKIKVKLESDSDNKLN